MKETSDEKTNSENRKQREHLLEETLEALKDEQIELMLTELSTFHAIFNSVPFILLIVDRNRVVRRINKGAAAQLEHGEADIIGLRAGEALGCIHTAEKPCGDAEECKHCPIKISMDTSIETGKISEPFEAPMEFNTDTYHKKILKVVSMPITLNREDLLLLLIEDITREKEAERRGQLDLKILKTLNEQEGERRFIHRILTLIQEFTGCDSIAIRLRENPRFARIYSEYRMRLYFPVHREKQDYPYYAYIGFPEEFIKEENRLCTREEGKTVLRCVCGAVLTKHTHPDLPLTRRGSFWTNSATELLAHHKKLPDNLLKHCNAAGYESIALIPLTSKEETIGLLQLCDHRYNRFNKDLIEYLEQLGESIAVAISKNLAEDALRESEKFLSTILNGISEGVVTVDRDYNILAANHAYLEQTGKKIDEVLGEKCYTISHHRNTPCTGATHTCPLTETLDTGQQAEALHTHFDKNNNRHYVMVRSHPVKNEKGEVVQVIVTVTDITRQKLAEDALREGMEQYRTLIENAPDAIAVHRDGKLLYLNPSGARLMGVTDPDELIGKPVMDFVHPDYRDIVKKRIREIEQGDRVAGVMEEKLVRPDGEVIDVEIAGMPVIYNGEKAIQVVLRDISERKRAEEERRESEKRYRTLFEQADDAILVLDAEGEQAGKIIDANQATADMHGYTLEEILTMNIRDLDAPEDAETLPERLQRMIEGERLKEELLHRRKDGSIFPVEISAGLLEVNKHKYILAIYRDISERKQLEGERDEYIQRLEKTTEKLELYSHLLAHDLKNMLQIIGGYAELLESIAPEYRELTENIRKPVDNAIQTITDLRELMKAEQETLHSIDLKEYLKEAVREAAHAFPETNYTLHLPEETLTVQGNQAITRLFYNLLHNAAIHNRGRVQVDVTLEKQDNHAVITTADNGAGIEKEILHNLFEQGVRGTSSEGTGLGLYIARKLAEKYGGTITAENRETGGAVFTVKLPLC